MVCGTVAAWSVPPNMCTCTCTCMCMCMCMCMLSGHLLNGRQPLLIELRLELALVPKALRLVSTGQLAEPLSGESVSSDGIK